MSRRRWSPPSARAARYTWQAPHQCGYCRKRIYPTRRAAKRALRSIYPDQVGQGMAVYFCNRGGDGYHLGHRDMWPSWTDHTDHPIGCDRCPARIHPGDPVAHLHGHRLCQECGDTAERAAIALRQQTHTTDTEPA